MYTNVIIIMIFLTDNQNFRKACIFVRILIQVLFEYKYILDYYLDYES